MLCSSCHEADHTLQPYTRASAAGAQVDYQMLRVALKDLGQEAAPIYGDSARIDECRFAGEESREVVCDIVGVQQVGQHRRRIGLEDLDIRQENERRVGELASAVPSVVQCTGNCEFIDWVEIRLETTEVEVDRFTLEGQFRA